MSEPSFEEQLQVYYKRLFPFDMLHQWLSYPHEENKDTFPNREFSLTLANGTYMRHNTFENKDTLIEEVENMQPIKIDIGAVYDNRPTRTNAPSLRPLQRELTFDIDLTDYDDVRKCCKETAICSLCWQYIIIACKILETALSEDLGYKHCLWVFSGRRGVHCWVSDKGARELTARARSITVEYLNLFVPRKNVTFKKKMALFKKRRLHFVARRAVKIIDEYFIELCVKGQDMLGSAQDIESFMGLIQDDAFKKELDVEFKNYETSLERWESFLALYDRFRTQSRLKYNMEYLVEQIKIVYAYPRLDVNVTKGQKHLLKSPFCVHPVTGKVCVPFSAKLVDKFDPIHVPTLNVLFDEINLYDSRIDPGVPSFCVKTINDGRKTSLIKALVVFEQFVRKLTRTAEKKETNGLDF